LLTGSELAGAGLHWRYRTSGGKGAAGNDGRAATANNHEDRAAIDREGTDTEATAAKNRQIYV